MINNPLTGADQDKGEIMIFTDKQAQHAFDYLKSSEEPHAQAKADLEAIKKHEKALVAKLKLQSSEKTSAAKDDEAYASTEYETWEAGMKEAQYNFSLIENKRDGAMTCLDLWRTASANARRL